MKFDVLVEPGSPAEVAGAARTAEALGIARLRVQETRHDPFVSSALALAATQRIEVGTEIAVAFARSPTVVALAAWDLAALSGGRFHLGLGSQVKAHIERRYGMVWDRPIGRMREFVQALDALWRCWQEGAPLRVEGRFYRLTLMTPYFNPGPIATPAVRVGLAGVNPSWARLAGEVAGAFHLHPLHTPSYLREVLMPALEEGLARSGRRRSDFELVGTVFAAVGEAREERARQREAVRQQVAFYASTPSYRRVPAHHGRDDVGERLSQLAREGRWDEMASALPDDLLDLIAVEAHPDELADRLLERYGGLLDRVALHLPFQPGEHDAWWARWAERIHR